MIRIVYPDVNPRVRKKELVTQVYCIIRKRWVKLTKEEWVRQNFLLFLIHSCGYPLSLIAVEKKINVGELDKRFDIVVFNKEQPFMVVECKEMGAPVDTSVLLQALRYNTTLQAPYIALTNGLYTYLFKPVEGDMLEVDSFPEWMHT
jgi:hypothetical protein